MRQILEKTHKKIEKQLDRLTETMWELDDTAKTFCDGCEFEQACPLKKDPYSDKCPDQNEMRLLSIKRERNKQERDRTVCTLETLADLIMKITNMEYR